MEWLGSALSLAFSGLIFYGLWKLALAVFGRKVRLQQPMVCTTCGSTVTHLRRTIKGSIWLELFCWCLFILPGIIYSIWRNTTRANVCPECGAAGLVPLASPKGQELLAGAARAAGAKAG